MSAPVASIATPLLDTVRDVIPIAAILLFFQLVVLRRRIADPRRVVVGLACVVAGLTLFIVGLEEALFPIGETMAAQLTDPSFVGGSDGGIEWWDYYWVYAFAAAIGFASTIAEPALIAVSLKAEEASGGTIRPFHLRIAVAVGVAVSIALGALRIVTGAPLELFMVAGYVVVLAQTVVGPRQIVPLAYDSGGVTTSTVTVPLVTALGLGLASTVPGRSPLLDGFGMIALAALFAVVAVLGYAQLAELQGRRQRRRAR